jgi:hypothetical protein
LSLEGSGLFLAKECGDILMVAALSREATTFV